YPYIVEQDPMEARGKLPVFTLPERPKSPPRVAPEKLNTSVPVRTALSIEVRDGVICAFMPPVERIEDYLELVAALEATAEEMQLHVHVEGYAPP
ncbi:transglutaminase family protein, partial [Acinetobacter baumannii]